MNKLFTLLLLSILPSILFSQSNSEINEKNQKKQERINPNNNNGDIIIIPNNNLPVYPNNFRRNSFYNPYYINPYNNFNPYPSYGFNYENNMELSLGITSGFGKYPYSLGGYLTYGTDKAFLIMSYEASQRLPFNRGNEERRVYWDNITLDDVLYWNDLELNRDLRYNSFGIGVGGDLSDRFSPFVLVDFFNVEGEFVFYDETGVLDSPNNEYMIIDDYETGINLRLGTFYQINSVRIGSSLSVFSPFRINTSVGFIF
jgi:hypothetical protein